MKSQRALCDKSMTRIRARASASRCEDLQARAAFSLRFVLLERQNLGSRTPTRKHIRNHAFWIRFTTGYEQVSKPVFLRRHWHMSGTCLAYVCHMSGTCVARVWHMCSTCVAHVWHMCDTCLAHVWPCVAPKSYGFYYESGMQLTNGVRLPGMDAMKITTALHFENANPILVIASENQCTETGDSAALWL